MYAGKKKGSKRRTQEQEGESVGDGAPVRGLLGPSICPSAQRCVDLWSQALNLQQKNRAGCLSGRT